MGKNQVIKLYLILPSVLQQFKKNIVSFFSATLGPSSRSGHRMVLSKKNLVVFGGYHDNGIDYKYYNDVHLFDLESRTWRKIEPAGNSFILYYTNALLIYLMFNIISFCTLKVLPRLRDLVVKWLPCPMGAFL